MRLRDRSPENVAGILGAGWGSAALLTFGASAWDWPEWPILGLILLLAYGPTIIATAWGFGQPAIARWHIGKLALLWLAAATVFIVASSQEAAIGIVFAIAVAPRLFAASWTWLSGREK